MAKWKLEPRTSWSQSLCSFLQTKWFSSLWPWANYLAYMHIGLLCGKTWMITAAVSPAGLLWGSKVRMSVKVLWSLSHYPNTWKGFLLLGGTPTKMGQIWRGDKEEASIGGSGGELGKSWETKSPRGGWGSQQVEGSRVWSNNPEHSRLGPGSLTVQIDGLKTNKRKWYFEIWVKERSLSLRVWGIFTRIIPSNLHRDPGRYMSSPFHNWVSEAQ